MANPPDEKELISAVVESDRRAFSLLYTQYLDSLFRYVYLFTKSTELSDEIVQKVFVKIWERRENLTNVNSFRAYLFRSAKNQLLDEIRRNQAESKMLLYLKPDTEESTDRSDYPVLYGQYYQIVQDAIKLLPEKRKMIVELRTRDDLTLDEIAEKLSISKFVVKKQLYEGLRFVRAYLKKHGELTAALLLFLRLWYD